MKLRSLALSATLISSLAITASPMASADVIDDALNALPAGQISCAQAERYWTSEADYNNKVAQANALAVFDSRGPQIRQALARVDEAANRCGLKASTRPASDKNNGQNSTTAITPETNAPAPIVSIIAPGTPSFTIEIPDVGGIQLPDLNKIVQQFLAQFSIAS